MSEAQIASALAVLAVPDVAPSQTALVSPVESAATVEATVPAQAPAQVVAPVVAPFSVAAQGAPASLFVASLESAPPAARAKPSTPALELLLPREWRGDRHKMGAWQKGRTIAAAGGVAWGSAGSEVAAIASRSEEPPRAVDLASCTCSCPNPAPFCAHLYAAVHASGCERLRGRAALLCLLRERSRTLTRSPEAAKEVAGLVLAELGDVAPAEMLTSWALDALFRLQKARRHGAGPMRQDAPGGGTEPSKVQMLWLEAWGPLPGTGRLGCTPASTDVEAARASLNVGARRSPSRSRSPRRKAGGRLAPEVSSLAIIAVQASAAAADPNDAAANFVADVLRRMGLGLSSPRLALLATEATALLIWGL